MKHTVFLISVLSVMLLSVACGGGSTPVPYLKDQNFNLLDGCETDFSEEVGACVTLRDGWLDPVCKRNETECVEHFYVTKRHGRPFFVHVNAAYPCYPDWIIDAYSNPESDYYLDYRYRVVDMQIAGAANDDVLHIIEALHREELQSSQTCYYRLEASVADLTQGSYDLKVWTPDNELIVKIPFDN